MLVCVRDVKKMKRKECHDFFKRGSLKEQERAGELIEIENWGFTPDSLKENP